MKTPSKEPAPTPDSKVYSFRCKRAEAEQWDAKIAASGHNKSEFFRQAVQENKSTVALREVVTQDQRRALFLLAHLSNTLSQMAHRLESDYKAGLIPSDTYHALLTELSSIAETAKTFGLKK